MEVLTPLFSALVGGCISGYLTYLLVTRRIFKHDLEKQNQKQEATIKGVLQAIYEEVEAVWQHYRTGAGAYLEVLDDNEPLLVYYPTSHECFTIYNSNSHWIGQIKDDDLRKAIVHTYSKAKSLVDSCQLNNYLIQEYERLAILGEETKSAVYTIDAEVKFKRLIGCAKILKSIDEQLKQDVDSLLQLLKEAIPPNRIDG